jgi:hypothetical protein
MEQVFIFEFMLIMMKSDNSQLYLGMQTDFDKGPANIDMVLCGKCIRRLQQSNH